MYRLLCLSLLFALPVTANAQDWFRDQVPAATRDLAAANGEIGDWRAIAVDWSALTLALQTARQGDTPFTLPLADGRSMRLRVSPTEIMATGLAARYPDIRSYRGVDVDNPQRRVRLELSPLGFGAMLFAPEGIQLLQASSLGDRQNYIVYARTQVQGSTRPSCGFDADSDIARGFGEHLRSAPSPRTETGATLRTYRLAVATTGEYTARFGGTVAGGLAAVVVAINRVNEVYQTDLGVRLTLIASNDQVIYTDAATDPYTNNSGTTMLGQNQTTLDTVIGNANYDVGHVFSTGGGGVATLGVPCRAGQKARGVTGLGNPVGDPFYIDYVAHEIGHQFGGRHTFNGSTGSCAGGNRSASAAYEPGSGSTIMAYAGICGAENLQNNSDPYFHAKSLEEIQAYISGANGNSCPAQLNTGGNLPVVSAGNAATIPSRTPFTLLGSGSSPAANPLSFMYEQYDLGAASPPNTDNGNRPLFRSFVATSAAERTLPRLASVLNTPNNLPLGEAYATTDRQLNFRLTARDLRTAPGGIATGATVSSDVALSVISGAGPFTVNTPVAGGSFIEGQLIPVTWSVAGTDAAPISCSAVELAISTDGGQNFSQTLLASTANDGSESVPYQGPASDNARLRVRCLNQPFFNVNPGNFRLTSGLFANGFEAP